VDKRSGWQKQDVLPARNVNPTALRGWNLMKRFMLLTVILTVLAIPSALLAANKLAVGEVDVAGKTISVPLDVTNADGLIAMDIPLRFSEGVELKAVNFENTSTTSTAPWRLA
jgi:hypothetical protein